MSTERSDRRPSAPAHDEFLRVFLANQRAVYRYIVTVVPQSADAEDVFQQTCLTLWEKMGEFDRGRDFTRWAFGIAHNHVRNHLRKLGRQPLLDDALLAEVVERREAEATYFDHLNAALADCLKLLPAPQRRLVEQCYGGEASIKDVADRQGRTPNAIYKQLRHLRGVLFDCVTRRAAPETAR